jgi:hypothetical protein
VKNSMLSKRISQRKADLARKTGSNERITEARVHWDRWVDDQNRAVEVSFVQGEVYACFSAVANYYTEEVIESTGILCLNVHNGERV